MKHGAEAGGLSGEPVREMSTEVIKQFYKILKEQIPIIGVGGIASAQDAQDKLDAGAVLVQVYSGLIYEGPSTCEKNAITLKVLSKKRYIIVVKAETLLLLFS